MKKKVMLLSIGIIIVSCIAIALSFAYFTMTTTITNNITYNTTFGNGYNFTVDVGGSANEVVYGIRDGDMLWSGTNEVAASSYTTFNFSLVNNSTGNITCAYDYVWLWEAGFNSYSKTSGATEEFVAEVDGARMQVPNYSTAETVITRGAITAAPGTTSYDNSTASTYFYNLTIDQSTHKNKHYKGHIAVKNVVCGKSLVDYIANDAPTSGTSSVGTAAWTLNSDRTGEYRYSGMNPDNYILINSEKWRIIGVMPDIEYSYSENGVKKKGTLVKLIRNTRHGTGSWASSTNDWTQSTLRTTLDTAYGSFSNVVYASWPLYGTPNYNTDANGNAEALYNEERNIGGAGAVNGTNATVWSGRVGLMYPSDYGYATNGNGSASGTYSRTGCLSTTIYNWGDGDYKTYCATNDWLWYSNASSSSVGTAYTQWTLTQESDLTNYVLMISGYGYITSSKLNNTSYSIRPVVFLGPTALINGGSGTFANPYTLK